MNTLPPNSLIQISAAGGGFRIDSEEFSVADLVRIAAAAQPGARIEIEHGANRAVSDLVQIAAAGRGAVFFV